MAEAFQDDGREGEMIQLFNLIKDDGEGRSGIDGFLELDGQRIPFELKTTSDSRGSVTTVRDFGPDHIRKWQGKHWLFGFYSGSSVRYKYGSPSMMLPWINQMERYVRPDFMLASIASSHLELQDMYRILGEKEIYTLEDAQSIQKRQYLSDKYVEMMDIRVVEAVSRGRNMGSNRIAIEQSGYSQQRMLEILQDRAKYLIERGSTLNNPHISGSYFNEWEEITSGHANRLRELVREAMIS